MNDKDKDENTLSKFSNQDPSSGGYGDREEAESARSTKPKTSTAAKKARKKNRK